MIRLAIVGLGRIGASYPDVHGIPRSHLSAALATKGMTVSVLVDPDESNRVKAGQRVPSAALFASFDDVPSGAIDAVIDARPVDQGREALAALALEKGVKVVILEKPFAVDMTEGHALSELAKTASATLRVNFHRRFDTRHRQARHDLQEPVIATTALYSKGLQNYGSHLIDLMREWIGPIAAVRASYQADDNADPSIEFDLQFVGGARGTVRVLEAASYDVFDVSFFTKNSRLDMENGGAKIRFSRAIQDAIYPGYRHLMADVPVPEDTPVAGLIELHENIVTHLTDGVPLGGATVHEALEGLAVMQAIRASHANGGLWQPIEISSNA